MHITSISGSPSARSRSAWLSQFALTRLEGQATSSEHIALRGKTVLPLATGGSAAHLLALDYALKPVLPALGARHVQDGVFATDAQLQRHEAGGYVPEPELLARLDRALEPIAPAARIRSAAELGCRR